MNLSQPVSAQTTLTNRINNEQVLRTKTGFTLAEVLITLVIIGIIAAMTVPTLMTNTNSQEYRSGLKKAIASLNQGLTMQYALNGTMLSDFFGGTFTPTIVRDQVFVQRLNVLQTDNTSTTYGAGNTSTANFYTADGMKFGLAAGPSGSTCDAAGASPCYTVYIDVNGNKGPNMPTTATTHPNDIYTAILYAQRVIPYNAISQGVMYDQ
jgi:prepilin-type N-terminal cleavage/methylation domain-containing protein